MASGPVNPVYEEVIGGELITPGLNVQISSGLYLVRPKVSDATGAFSGAESQWLFDRWIRTGSFLGWLVNGPFTEGSMTSVYLQIILNDERSVKGNALVFCTQLKVPITKGGRAPVAGQFWFNGGVSNG